MAGNPVRRRVVLVWRADEPAVVDLLLLDELELRCLLVPRRDLADGEESDLAASFSPVRYSLIPFVMPSPVRVVLSTALIARDVGQAGDGPRSRCRHTALCSVLGRNPVTPDVAAWVSWCTAAFVDQPLATTGYRRR
jgi:hypothetical protein